MRERSFWAHAPQSQLDQVAGGEAAHCMDRVELKIEPMTYSLAVPLAFNPAAWRMDCTVTAWAMISK